MAVGPGGTLGSFDRPEFDRYRIEQEVGAGGMSVVYAARDLDLDRQVALKVMRRDVGPDQDQARLREEARSLAGLNHPNIVPVYDVGYALDGRLYMSMELVRGKNLRAWLDTSPRPVAEIVDVLMAAGQGLAAAHEVGLVHCDFKPSNVLVGDDGRVRVVDFGIARRVLLSETVTAQSDSEMGLPKRDRPQVIGTPRYMSPEQARAQPLDEKSDQFSFCLTLYEALYGQVPFLGQSNRQRVRNILAGKIRKPPRGSLVPSRIHAIVVRGLAADPAARWRNMDTLLRALAKARSRTKRWIPLAAVTTLGCGMAALSVAPRQDPCATTRDEVDAVWSDTRRERLREAFVGSGLPEAAREHERLERDLTAFADDWAAARARVCEADTTGSDARTARRSCLQRGLEQFAVLVEVLSTADVATIREATEAVAALPNVALCEATSSPTNDAPTNIRDRVEKLEEELAAAPMLITLHRYRRADELTAAVLHEAEALGHMPLLAEARYRRADVLSGMGREEHAAEMYEKAFHTAETARMDRLAAEIAVDLQLVYGYRLARPKLADRWSKQARAAVERLGDDAGSLRAEYIRTEGIIALRRSEYELARRRFEEALAAFDALEHPEVLSQAEALSNLGIANLELGDIVEAEKAFSRALTLAKEEVGPYNNRLITITNNLGSLAQARGDHQASHDYFERVYEAELALYGPVDVRVAMSLNNMGSALSALRRDDEAVKFYERSIRAYESGDHHGVDLARPVGNLAVTYMRERKYDEAEANLLRAIELIEADSGPMQADLSIHWFNLAAVRIETGDLERAREALERCNEIDEQALGREHPNIAQNLAAIATIHVQEDEPARAEPLLEEALAIFSKFEVDPVVVGFSQAALGKLLWARGERERARELLDAAERAFSDAGASASPQLEGLEAWKTDVGY